MKKWLKILIATSLLYAQGYRITYKVKLEQAKKPLGFFTHFTIYKNVLYIPDVSFEDVKIYNIKTGKLLKAFKRKGLGPGEFFQPQYVSVNKDFFLLTGMLKRILYRRNNFSFIREYKIVGSRFILLPNGRIAGNRYHRENGKLYTLFLIDLEGNLIKRFGKIKEKNVQEEGKSRIYPYKFLISSLDRIIYVEEWNGRVMIFDLEGNLLRRFYTRKESLPKYSRKLAKLMFQALTEETLKAFAENRKKNPMMVGVALDGQRRVHLFYFLEEKLKLWGDVYTETGKFLFSAPIPLPLGKDDSVTYIHGNGNKFYIVVRNVEEEEASLYCFVLAE